MLLKEVSEHLGSHCGRVADVNEGQVAEEEVHGGMELAFIENSYDNEGIPNQRQDIENEEHSKHSHLHLLIYR